MNLLNKLPPPPQGKTGWPWTLESSVEKKVFDKSLVWPKISIVTPSFNQGEFIEHTIRSVLLQNYPNLEYIVIDGGSSDDTVDIIKKYEPWLGYWVSEPDAGQSDAINKGFNKARGDIYAWLNSDDFYKPGALIEVASRLELNGPGWLIGACEFVDRKGKEKLVYSPCLKALDFKKLLNWGKHWIAQPSVFWNRSMFERTGLLNEELHYVMDVDFWFRMAQVAEPKTSSEILSCFRKHENAKTTASRDKSREELVNLLASKFMEKPDDLEINLKFVFQSLLDAHDRATKLQNLTRHVVIGKFIKFWKFFINRNLQIY